VWNPQGGATNCQTLSAACATFSITAQNCGSSSTSGAPVSFPEIIYGFKDSGDYSQNAPTPKQESAIASAPTSWSFNVPSSGTFNAVYDLWFNVNQNDYTVGNPPTGAYVQVWPYVKGSVQPPGSPTSTVTIGGAVWTVWTGGTGANGKPYIAYVANPLTTSVNIDLKPFFADAVSRGVIQSSWYLSAVQAGFEIWSGGAGLATTTFSAAVN
jgi:hypothetical protein